MPKHRSWVSGRESPGRRLLGAAVKPLIRWGQGRAEVSPTRRQARNAQRHTLRSAGEDSMSDTADEPLSKRAANRRVSLGVHAGGRTGDAQSPRKVRAGGSTAHTLYKSLSLTCTHNSIVREEN